jgi:hypothetical protein
MVGSTLQGLFQVSHEEEKPWEEVLTSRSVWMTESFALTEPFRNPSRDPKGDVCPCSLIREDVVDDTGDRTFRSGNTPGQRHAMRDVGGGTPKHHLEQ